MDRSKNWALTDQAYNCLVLAEGRPADDAAAAVQESYRHDQTPDHLEMFDEYIPPHVMAGYDGIRDGDGVLHTNFRQDRAIQLTRAFIDRDYPGRLTVRPRVTYVGLTRYYNEFKEFMLQALDAGGDMNCLLGEVISQAGLKQLRISETQKFRHVTSFFNGKSTTPFPNEDQVEIKSRFDPATYASHPEMEAYEVAKQVLQRLQNTPYDFILVNFANCDMVGHTGVFEAARRAVEIVDDCVGRLVEWMLARDFQILITSDHGNAEQMIDYETGMTKTSHTTFPVDVIYAAQDSPGRKLIPRGKLADVAVTVIKLLGLDVPTEMSAQSLLVRTEET